jgi:hypothetical protein
MDYIFAVPVRTITFIDKLFYINSLVNGTLGIGILFLVFFMLWLMMKSFSYEKGFSVSMLITSVLGFMLSAFSHNNERLIPDGALTILIVLFIVSLWLLMNESSKTDF